MATIAAHHARAALRGLERSGFNPDDVLLEAGINPDLLLQPAGRVYDDQMTRLIQLIWHKLEDEFMGFTRYPCKRGAFAYMCKTIKPSRNLRDALYSGMRFYSFVTEDITTRLVEKPAQVEIEVEFSNPELDPEHFYLEFWLVIWHRLASWLTATPIPLREARLMHQSPDHLQELRHLFPCNQVLRQTANTLAFDPEYLSLEIVKTEYELNEFLRRSPYDLLTIPGVDSSLHARVRRYLVSRAEKQVEFPSFENVAESFELNPQSLYRSLLREGYNFRQIKEDVRRDLAVNLLVKERWPVYRVAEATGYSEARSFTRAFQNWTGLSPREYCRFL